MRGDTVFRIYGLHEGRKKDHYFQTFASRGEAEAEIQRLTAQEMGGRNWAQQHHNRGFVIREHTVDVDFEIPPLPKPRDKYVAAPTAIPNQPGTWDSTLMKVMRRSGGLLEPVCEFKRNYSLMATFEPFRQGSREFALVSPDYTSTAVLDLSTGEIIAMEQSNTHFCPVGFYVPDWWDVNDDSMIPGSPYWNEDQEWPIGDFGFVWGCVWGDDSSWKVQYLDLRRIQEGVIRREERFGYVELANIGYTSPCFQLDPPEANSDPPDFIQLEREPNQTRVTFAVEMGFDLDSGKAQEWRRLSSDDFDESDSEPENS